MELFVSHLGPLGDGISKTRKGTVFVDRTAPQELVEADLYRDKQNTVRATIRHIIEPSPFRTAPSCRHFDVCGNCSLQHLKKDFYKNWKLETVKQMLSGARVKVANWEKPVFIQAYSRRRLTISATLNRNKVELGYYQRRTKKVFNLTECEIAHPDLLKTIKLIKPHLFPLLKDKKTLDIFFQLVAGRMEVIFVGLKNIPLSVLSNLKSIKTITRIGNQTPRGIQILFDSKQLTASFGELNVALPPFSFLQPTFEGEKALVDSVLSHFSTSREKIADLFSGCGTFTGPLLSKGSVSAYESQFHAVKSLQKAGADFPQLKVFQRDLFKNPLKVKELNLFDAIVFDPPRAGCREQAVQMAKSDCPFLVGVSCNPSTFSRDAEILQKGGYQLKSLKVVDQFLWSPHVELVGIFKRKS